jgi:CHAD domain-containing protein
MQNRLIDYLSKQCGLFQKNFNLVISDFDEDAIHDMRVAIKRIRAVFLLTERLIPGEFDALAEEGEMRRLFRLSGRMRDAQVQQLLLSTAAQDIGSTFGEYQTYLQTTESKAVKKFKKFLKEYDAEDDLKQKHEKVADLISKSGPEQVRLQIVQFVDELLMTAGKMHSDYEHDENLHEIRRKLKQCHYLLSVFNQRDPDLPQLKTTLKKLDKVNELLGNWHDQLVAMEMLDRFLEEFRKKGEAGENRYLLLRSNLAENRYLLYNKVVSYFTEKLNI